MNVRDLSAWQEMAQLLMGRSVGCPSARVQPTMIDLHRRLLLPVFLMLASFDSIPLQGQTPAWVGLYEDNLVDWLENENRITALCQSDSVPDLGDCYREVLAPEVRAWPVHVSPDAGSAELGQVLVVAVPGRGLSAYWLETGQAHATSFIPDVYDQDWGYGPHFDQTVLDRSGRWFLLPADPFPQPGWIFLGDNAEVQVRTVDVGDIVTLDALGWVVLEITGYSLGMRREQEGDMWCEVGETPDIVPDSGQRFSRADLLDSRGHWRMRPRYLRGC